MRAGQLLAVARAGRTRGAQSVYGSDHWEETVSQCRSTQPISRSSSASRTDPALAQGTAGATLSGSAPCTTSRGRSRTGSGDPHRRPATSSAIRSPRTPWSSRPIRAIQELLGHSDVEITMVYTHVLPEDYLGYEAPPICTEERRDLLRAA